MRQNKTDILERLLSPAPGKEYAAGAPKAVRRPDRAAAAPAKRERAGEGLRLKTRALA
jgi:hypothetical protein